jgi:anti-anti-sigma factor
MTDNVIEMKAPKIGTWEAGANMVLTPKESLTYQNCEEIEGVFDEYIEQFKTKIILDCREIAFMDSKGLELLLRIDEKLRKRGGTFKIVGLNSICRDIFIATRFINMLSVYKDINEAIRSMS